ncbi:MAG: NmrA family NAD(P)-binding protein [Burkholderiales bacterium]|nr:NmrA family NAD(P)-binding protein [Burkholderiales bacterium]
MIVVTGAAGFSGQSVIRALKRAGRPVRALVKNAAQAAALQGLGADHVLPGDMRDPAVVRAALAGAQALYFICPRFAEDEPAIGALWIRAAEDARLPRFVYHGVAHPYIADMPHHWDKLAVQLALERSSLPFTVLQPTNYMRNVTWAWNRLVEGGIYRLPYSADAPLTWVDADDVAEAAARVLTEPGHDCGIYELCGTDGAITRRQLCALLSERLGKTIRAEEAGWEDWQHLPRYRGWTPGQMARLKAMFDYYGRHGFRAGNTRVLAMLLGRAQTGYAQYLDGLMRLPAHARQAVL